MLPVVEALQRLYGDAGSGVELERCLIELGGLLRTLLSAFEQLRSTDDQRGPVRVVRGGCIGELRQIAVDVRPTLLCVRSLLGRA